jgi:hypothetical protein
MRRTPIILTLLTLVACEEGPNVSETSPTDPPSEEATPTQKMTDTSLGGRNSGWMTPTTRST